MSFEKDTRYLSLYEQQKIIEQQVIQKDCLPQEIRFIAGADVAYDETKGKVVAGFTVLDVHTLEITDCAWHVGEISFPYVPGLFSFREVPPLLEAWHKLQVIPQLVICDGHGMAHPDRVGMACHLGVELDVPAIGCAKHKLIGEYKVPGNTRGDFSFLIWKGLEVGCVLRTRENVKPVFVSVGHKISLTTARKWVLKMCSEFRLPETTRSVDQMVRRVMREDC